MALVTPALGDAVFAGEAWPATRIVRVYVDDDQYPRSRRWLDRSIVGDLDEQTLPLRSAEEQGAEPVCYECLYSWLRARGVDVARSPEEQRFERLSEALTALMRPRLEPILTKLLVGQTGTKGWGFPTSRGRPFVAYAEADLVVAQVDGDSYDRSAVELVKIVISDQLDHLVATASIALPGSAPPANVVGPIRIELAGGEIDAVALAATAAWADVLTGYLRRWSK